MVKSVRRKSPRKSKSIIRTKSKSIRRKTTRRPTKSKRKSKSKRKTKSKTKRRKKVMKGGRLIKLKSEGRLTNIGHEIFEKLKVVRYNESNDSYSATISHNNYILVIEYMLENLFNQAEMYKITSFDLKLKDKTKTLDYNEYMELTTNDEGIVSFTIKTADYWEDWKDRKDRKDRGN